MNIHDVEEEFEVPESDQLKVREIFARQLELREKYHHIEQRNGFHVGDGIPLDLHNRHDQHHMKDLAWRCIEEIAEALECRHDTDHSQEELADALHFLVELMLVAGVESDDLGFVDESPHYPNQSHLTEFIEKLGTSMNCLKNKPWKNAHMMTDERLFKKKLRLAWASYMYLLKQAGMNSTRAYLLYFKKSEVNKFRQRSNY